MNIAKQIVPDSSHIAAYQYDENSRTLTIWFNSNPEMPYTYSDVQPDVAQQFHEAGSKGKFFHGFIKNFYDYSAG